jgi:hypothetical protein
VNVAGAGTDSPFGQTDHCEGRLSKNIPGCNEKASASGVKASRSGDLKSPAYLAGSRKTAAPWGSPAFDAAKAFARVRTLA